MRTPILLVAQLLGASAHTQTEAYGDRLSLPEGPGALEGVGDNATTGGNRGSMRFAADIDCLATSPASPLPSRSARTRPVATTSPAWAGASACRTSSA